MAFPEPTNRTLLYKRLEMRSDSFAIEMLFEPKRAQVRDAAVFSMVSDANQGVALQSVDDNQEDYVLAFGNGNEWRVLTNVRPNMDGRNRLLVRKTANIVEVKLNDAILYSGIDPVGIDFDAVTLTVGAPFGAGDAFRGTIREVVVSR